MGEEAGTGLMRGAAVYHCAMGWTTKRDLGFSVIFVGNCTITGASDSDICTGVGSAS